MLVHHEVFQGAVLLVGELDALDPLGGLGEVLGEALPAQEVQGLGLTERALRVLQVAHVVLGVRPERAPQRDDDLFLLVDRVAQLGEHRRGGGRRQAVAGLLQTVGREHTLLRGLGQARAGLDADDPAVEFVRVVGQVGDRGDLAVLGHGEGEDGVVVVGADVLDPVPVLLHVGGVGDLGPRRGEHVDITLGERSVEHAGLADLLVLDRVAGLFEDVFQQVGGTQAIRPGRDVAEGDGVTLTGATVATAVAVTVAAGRQRQSQRGGSGHGSKLTTPRGGGSHVISFFCRTGKFRPPVRPAKTSPRRPPAGPEARPGGGAGRRRASGPWADRWPRCSGPGRWPG